MPIHGPSFIVGVVIALLLIILWFVIKIDSKID